MSGWDKAVKAAEIAKNVANFVGDHKLASSALKAIGQDQAARVAEALGAGKRKRKRSKKRPSPIKRRKHKGGQKAGSFFGDLAGKLFAVPASGVAGALGGLTAGLSGLGKRKRGGFLPSTPSMRGPIMF